MNKVMNLYIVHKMMQFSKIKDIIKLHVKI